MQTYASDIHLHRVTVLLLLACLLAAAVGCGATTQLAQTAECGTTSEPLSVAELTRQQMADPALLMEVARARYLVLGETHDNPEHHLLQAQLLQHFLKAQPGAAVAFEMLDEDVAGRLEPQPQSAAELAERSDWANSGWPPFTQYQPIIEVALAARARLVAAHPSAEHVRASMRGLEDAEARDLRLDTRLPDEQINAQYEEIRESHCGHANDQMLTAMQRAQVYKDAFMARALARTGVPTALITGRGHARNDRAVPYFLQRQQAGSTLSIAFVEDPSYETSAFDHLVFTTSVRHEDPCEKFRKQLEEMRQRHQPAPETKNGTAPTAAPSNNTTDDGTR